MLDYWWLLCLIPLAAALFLMLSEGREKKLKIKIRRLKRKLSKYEKGAEDMSKVICDLVGKRCKINIYGEIKVIDADDEWIKFEYLDKRGNRAVKILRTDELTAIDLLDE